MLLRCCLHDLHTVQQYDIQYRSLQLIWINLMPTFPVDSVFRWTSATTRILWCEIHYHADFQFLISFLLAHTSWRKGIVNCILCKWVRFPAKWKDEHNSKLHGVMRHEFWIHEVWSKPLLILLPVPHWTRFEVPAMIQSLREYVFNIF